MYITYGARSSCIIITDPQCLRRYEVPAPCAGRRRRSLFILSSLYSILFYFVHVFILCILAARSLAASRPEQGWPEQARAACEWERSLPFWQAGSLQGHNVPVNACNSASRRGGDSQNMDGHGHEPAASRYTSYYSV